VRRRLVRVAAHHRVSAQSAHHRHLDIVSIATPNHLHADQTVAAARAGRDVLLENPTGLDVDELVRMITGDSVNRPHPPQCFL
jgi:predicted dehydrogenase